MIPAAAMAALILAPLLGAALAFALPRLGRWLAFIVAGVTAWCAVALGRHVHDAGPIRHLVEVLIFDLVQSDVEKRED